MSFLPRIVAAALKKTSANVLVLIPPAVEPEPPPINMRNIIINRAGIAIAPISIVLNPAVRAVMLWKKLCDSCVPTLPSKLRVSAKTAPPTTRSIPATDRPIFVPRRRPRQLLTTDCLRQGCARTSDKVPKPIPPRTINTAIIQCTFGK